MATNKSEFIARYMDCSEGREGASDYLSFVENSDFFTAPASTKFHGNYDGGLCEHSLLVDDCLSKLLDTFDTENTIDRKIAHFVALNHDACKINFYKRGSRNVKEEETGKWVAKQIWEIDEKIPLGHGEKSCIILMSYMKLSLEELLAIRHHMGGFDSAVKGGDYSLSKAYEKSNLAVFLHVADMISTYTQETTV